MNSENSEEIRNATEDLNSVVQQIGCAAYQQVGPAAGRLPGRLARSGSRSAGDQGDGEFRNA